MVQRAAVAAFLVFDGQVVDVVKIEVGDNQIPVIVVNHPAIPFFACGKGANLAAMDECAVSQQKVGTETDGLKGVVGCFIDNADRYKTGVGVIGQFNSVNPGFEIKGLGKVGVVAGLRKNFLAHQGEEQWQYAIKSYQNVVVNGCIISQ